MSEQQISERKITSLEALIGTEETNKCNLESFADGMQQVRKVLAAASTLASYYGQPENRFCNDNGKVELPDLSEVIGQILGDQVEVLTLLQRKGEKLATPPSVVVPPATVKFGTARRAAKKGKV